MKAKDTVMTDGELEAEIRKDYKDFTIKEQTPEIEDVLCWTREAQAEISFKAGIREVVEWMFESCPHAPKNFPSDKRMCVQCCEAKLKEWGVE